MRKLSIILRVDTLSTKSWSSSSSLCSLCFDAFVAILAHFRRGGGARVAGKVDDGWGRKKEAGRKLTATCLVRNAKAQHIPKAECVGLTSTCDTFNQCVVLALYVSCSLCMYPPYLVYTRCRLRICIFRLMRASFGNFRFRFSAVKGGLTSPAAWSDRAHNFTAWSKVQLVSRLLLSSRPRLRCLHIQWLETTCQHGPFLFKSQFS